MEVLSLAPSTRNFVHICSRSALCWSSPNWRFRNLKIKGTSNNKINQNSQRIFRQNSKISFQITFFFYSSHVIGISVIAWEDSYLWFCILTSRCRLPTVSNILSLACTLMNCIVREIPNTAVLNYHEMNTATLNYVHENHQLGSRNWANLGFII